MRRAARAGGGCRWPVGRGGGRKGLLSEDPGELPSSSRRFGWRCRRGRRGGGRGRALGAKSIAPGPSTRLGRPGVGSGRSRAGGLRRRGGPRRRLLRGRCGHLEEPGELPFPVARVRKRGKIRSHGRGRRCSRGWSGRRPSRRIAPGIRIGVGRLGLEQARELTLVPRTPEEASAPEQEAEIPVPAAHAPPGVEMRCRVASRRAS